MSSGIDDLLDMVDVWKMALHDKLERMTPAKRRAFWNRIHQDAHKMGLCVADPEKPPKRAAKHVRRTG